MWRWQPMTSKTIWLPIRPQVCASLPHPVSTSSASGLRSYIRPIVSGHWLNWKGTDGLGLKGFTKKRDGWSFDSCATFWV
jgi:hypothetical protein